jgi:hypothetical protein
LLQRRCNISAVDADRCRARNDWMMADAHIPGSSPAHRACSPPADPREADKNGETPENAEARENGETLKTAKTPSHNPIAPACETLKQETVPASRGGAGAVTQAPARRRGISQRTVRETLKQRRKFQANEGITCFTANAPAGYPEMALRRYDIVGETLKHPARRPQVPSRAWGHETVKRLKQAPPPKRVERWPVA